MSKLFKVKKILFYLVCLLPTYLLKAQHIIPYAQHYESVSPSLIQSSNLSAIKFINADDMSIQSDVEVLNDFLHRMKLDTFMISKAKNNMIYIKLDKFMKDGEYKINWKENNIIDIAGSVNGIFNALMTIVQWKAASSYTEKMQLQHIHDFPSFSWRGMHLDVSRHFFDKEFVKKYIDILALHKMNVFHWHLTDDQGWRIEIKKYPKLTEIGSIRKETMVAKNFNPYVGDGQQVQGYYTQEDIKEVVAYAQKRHIIIVPEIEMPGHSVAALSAYPEYGCRKEKVDALTIWGVSDDVFCPNQQTIRFLEDILDEVMNLFPSKYIHIGGDEVPKANWKKCSQCQQTIKNKHLKDEHELQSYFIKQIDAYVNSKGRSIIGWDEILEGGLAENAAVMSWRGEDGGIAAAKQKHNVVMTPGSHCYFDHYQGSKNMEPLAIGGYTPIEKVYSYWPIPATLSTEQHKYILGAQANLWTEYIATTSHVEYMALPRLCALAEVLWTGKNKPGYNNFSLRLRQHFNLLDKLNIHYATSIFNVGFQTQPIKDYIQVELATTYKKGAIQYTIDGSDPAVNGIKYDSMKKIRIGGPVKLKAIYLEDGKVLGKELTQDFIYHQGVAKKISSTFPPSKHYGYGGLQTLQNGIVGQLPWVSNEWLGWSGQSPEINIDMAKTDRIHEIQISALKEESSWIYLPVHIEVKASQDGKTYFPVKNISTQEILSQYNQDKIIKVACEPKDIRYLKLNFVCAPKIPQGNPGEGEEAWLFLSEIVIN